MKKIINSIVLTVTSIVLLSGCTENQRAKQFGGTVNINLPANQKLVNATWNEAELWYLYRPMHTNEVAEIYRFVEKSSFGLMEGEVVFVENKQ